MRTHATTLAVLTFVLLAAPAAAGVFIKSRDLGNPPGIVVHPNTYTGTGGIISIGVCLNSTATDLSADLDFAIAKLNELRPMIRNCNGPCTTPEGTTPPGPYFTPAHSILVHELLHCAFGVDHIGWQNGATQTDFTNTREASSMTTTDPIKGNHEDDPHPLPGSRDIHWFRVVDNDPVVVDNAAIDSSTYSRDYQNDLPFGDWPASANTLVAASLGAPSTQSLMTAIMPINSTYLFLSSDDVNTVKFAMNGLDSDPGDTGDDYTYTLTHEPTCATAQIEVQLLPISDFGTCDAILTQIPDPTVINHYRTIPPAGHPRMLVTIDASPEVGGSIFVHLGLLITIQQFESGDFTGWSSVVP
jgi:hypothetical protein